ncbi:MAG: hypothetical protein ACJAT2_002552 [Bacteriovoracaceae bacterium]|jgi:hypothetical protein
MKKIIVVMAVLMSTTVLASSRFDTEEVVFKTMQSVHELQCVTRLGGDLPREERTFTELNLKYIMGGQDIIKIDPRRAIVKGCDLDLLDQIVNDSHNRFGHAEVTVTVTKEVSKKPRIVFGKCQKNYNEQVKIDFGQGTVLESSKLGILIPATGCLN